MSQPIRNAVTFVVDGREVIAPEGTMLVDAAKMGDVEIPVFCYEPKLGDPVGACRMCLVEIEGIPKLQTACSTPVRDGMVVYTQTDQVKEAQNAVVEFLLVNHPLDCPVCDKGGECPLQDIAMGWGPGQSRFTDPKRHFQKPLELSPLVAIDRERCILCYRCVRFSQEVSEDEQLQLLERGDRSFVGTFDERPYVAPFHGNIIELCPVGALTSYTYRFRARPWDIEDAGSVCTLCPSQCNVKFTVRDERVLRVLGRDNEAVDDGWLCDKGRFAFQMFNSDERITQPMLRAGDGSLSPLSWQQAVEQIAGKLRGAGTKAAALVGGSSSNEEGWLAQRLIRGALGGSAIASSPNPVEVGLLAELSRPELGAKMSDLDYAGAICVIGADPLHEMPILDLRIRKAVRRNGTKLLVASERPTALDGGAHEAIRYAPGERRGLPRRAAERSGRRERRRTTRRGGLIRRRAPSRDRRPDHRLGRAPVAQPGRGRGSARHRAIARHAQATGYRAARGAGGGECPRPARSRRDGWRRARAGGRKRAERRGDQERPRGARARRPADGQRRPGPRLSGRRRLAQGAGGDVRGGDLDVRRRVHAPGRHRAARRVLRGEGGHRHPSRRAPAAPAPERPAPRRGAPGLVGADAAAGGGGRRRLIRNPRGSLR